ncbi:flagellar hook-length control protein FliK [Shimia sp. SDUM112013]|uniref:flagellar hook-length control protein FliK n=1 Tax=Shimia sp. SDUM112013 TaxID=3136160 RepID=UPI0032EF1747
MTPFNFANAVSLQDVPQSSMLRNVLIVSSEEASKGGGFGALFEELCDVSDCISIPNAAATTFKDGISGADAASDSLDEDRTNQDKSPVSDTKDGSNYDLEMDATLQNESRKLSQNNSATHEGGELAHAPVIKNGQLREIQADSAQTIANFVAMPVGGYASDLHSEFKRSDLIHSLFPSKQETLNGPLSNFLKAETTSSDNARLKHIQLSAGVDAVGAHPSAHSNLEKSFGLGFASLPITRASEGVETRPDGSAVSFGRSQPNTDSKIQGQTAVQTINPQSPVPSAPSGLMSLNDQPRGSLGESVPAYSPEQNATPQTRHFHQGQGQSDVYVPQDILRLSDNARSAQQHVDGASLKQLMTKQPSKSGLSGSLRADPSIDLTNTPGSFSTKLSEPAKSMHSTPIVGGHEAIQGTTIGAIAVNMFARAGQAMTQQSNSFGRGAAKSASETVSLVDTIPQADWVTPAESHSSLDRVSSTSLSRGTEVASAQSFARPGENVSWSRQIAENVIRQVDGSIEIRLNPEELGRVRLSVTQSEQSIVISVQAERSETLELIRRHHQELEKELLSFGFEDAQFSFFERDQHKSESSNTSNDLTDIDIDTVTEDSTVALGRAQNRRDGAGIDIRI